MSAAESLPEAVCTIETMEHPGKNDPDYP
jgi:hypothetical protein